MKQKLHNSELYFSLSRINNNGEVRFIVQNTQSYDIPISISLFEAYLSNKHRSYNTVYSKLYNILFIFAWAEKNNMSLDSILLEGECLEPRQINDFAHWLKTISKKRDINKNLSPSHINIILSQTRSMFNFFADQYLQMDCYGSERAIKIRIYKDSIKDQFKNHKIKVKVKPKSGDLSEEEITIIEKFFKPELRIKREPNISRAKALRDYLIWRLAIEFGLREGEILAMRLDDCPTRSNNTIKIVRIEERDTNYVDPRQNYAPRPKTLSRELGFILNNSPIPRLIMEYTTKFRKRKVIKNGKSSYQWIMDKPAFLILSHHLDKGDPLSISSLQDIAEVVRNKTGIDFHWHLTRHAFFNRAYGAIADLKNSDNGLYQDRLLDLVYWGGWESEQSLQLYINRAREDKAKKTLCFFQNNSEEWSSLQ